MDDDFESELMDLETNECAYLPQAAHSRPPSSTALASPAIIASSTPSDRANKPRNPMPLPSALATSYATGARAHSLPASVLSALPVPPTSILVTETSSTGDTPLDAGEEHVGWYDQLEMLLATAEARYYAWVDEMETQGSTSEEEFRRAEAERIARRQLAVQELKETRRAVVYARLVECKNAVNDQRGSISVEEMMEKLAVVVDESAKQLKLVQRNGTWTELAKNLPPIERDYVAKGTDEMFLEKLKYKREQEETKVIIEQHLKALFQLQLPTRNGQLVGRTLNHSLGQTLREFADIFHFCYGDPAVRAALSVPGSQIAASRILALVAADINAFAAILVQILLYKYPDLPGSWATPILHRCVIDALFEHLQPTLHMLYVAAFEAENAHLSCRCQQLRSSRLDRFGVSSIFRLDGSWSPTGSPGVLRDANDLHLQSLRQYEPVINMMNALPTYRSPWVKATLVATVCKDVDTLVKEFYARQAAAGLPRPSASNVNMTADDLAALLAFLIVSSPTLCSHLTTQLALLGSYMESEMGEESFAVATLWTAVSHLCHLA